MPVLQAEIGRGWVKVIADFPDLAAGTDVEAAHRIEAVARLVADHQLS